MDFNLNNFKNLDHLEYSFSDKLELKNFNITNEEVILNIKSYLTKKKNRVIFSGKATFEFEVTCDLCLEKFTYSGSFEFNEIFYQNENEEAEFFICNNAIDLTNCINTLLLSNLPIKFLCNSNCKGLCYTCGINLNNHSCNCNNESEEYQWEV